MRKKKLVHASRHNHVTFFQPFLRGGATGLSVALLGNVVKGLNTGCDASSWAPTHSSWAMWPPVLAPALPLWWGCVVLEPEWAEWPIVLALCFLDWEVASSTLHFDLFDPLLDGEAMRGGTGKASHSCIEVGYICSHEANIAITSGTHVRTCRIAEHRLKWCYAIGSNTDRVQHQC